MTAAMWEAIILGEAFNLHRVWGVLAQTAVAAVVGTAVFLVLTWILDCEEIASIKVVLSKLTGRSLAGSTEERGS